MPSQPDWSGRPRRSRAGSADRRRAGCRSAPVSTVRTRSAGSSTTTSDPARRSAGGVPQAAQRDRHPVPAGCVPASTELMAVRRRPAAAPGADPHRCGAVGRPLDAARPPRRAGRCRPAGCTAPGRPTAFTGPAIRDSRKVRRSPRLSSMADDVPAAAEGHQPPRLQPPGFGRSGRVLAVVEGDGAAGPDRGVQRRERRVAGAHPGLQQGGG